MKALAQSQYVPDLDRGSRVRFVKKGDPREGTYCIVSDPLQNPSQSRMNQWYDVRFEDGKYLRCHGRDLEQVAQQPAKE